MKTVDELIEDVENMTTVIRNAFPRPLAVVSLSQEELDDLLYYLREYKRLNDDA